ncbi:MAG: hypothetical protein PVJ53_08500 [Desulfobacterales bacterium]
MIETIVNQTDAILIFFFRLLDNPMLGYLVGIAVLALLCTVIGDLTIALAFRLNGAFFRRDNQELVRMQNKSLLALQARDKASYQACNEVANESFGKVFFSQMALGASSLWPVPFALQWLDGRFADVVFLLPMAFGERTSVGYAFTFIPMVILMRIVFGRIRTGLPGYRRLTLAKHVDGPETEAMLRVGDVFPNKGLRKV